MDYTYDMFKNSISQLADDIEISMSHREDQYDYIVGVTRGGLIPAVFLSHRLSIPMISINWSTRDSGVKTIGNTTANILRGRNVLIVEDIVDSGETLKQLMIEMSSYCNIDVAALIYNTQQSVVPKFYDVTIDRTEYTHWINFFWEK